jgi:hypothetical protein
MSLIASSPGATGTLGVENRETAGHARLAFLLRDYWDRLGSGGVSDPVRDQAW